MNTLGNLINSYSPLEGNLIRNGSFDIWQRGNSFADANEDYTADRWNYHKNGIFEVTVRSASITNDVVSPLARGIQLDVDTALSSLDVQNVSNFKYLMEGYDYRNIIGKWVTLSFYLKSGDMTGTFSIAFRNAGNEYAYITERTITATNTWKRYEVTLKIPDYDDTGFGEPDLENLEAFNISFTFAAGSGKVTSTLDQWTDFSSETYDIPASSNQTNFLATTGTGRIKMAGVQLELGKYVTPFKIRNIYDELYLCQRYFFTTYPESLTPGIWDAPGTSYTNGYEQAPLGWRGQDDNNRTAHSRSFRFPCVFRTMPTYTTYGMTNGTAGRYTENTDTDSAAYTLTLKNSTEKGLFYMNTGVAVDNGDRVQFHLTADAEL